MEFGMVFRYNRFLERDRQFQGECDDRLEPKKLIAKGTIGRQEIELSATEVLSATGSHVMHAYALTRGVYLDTIKAGYNFVHDVPALARVFKGSR